MRFYPTKLGTRIPLIVALIILSITTLFFSWYIEQKKKEILRQHIYQLKESAISLRSAINFVSDKDLNQGILDNFYEQLKKEEEKEAEEKEGVLLFPGHEVHLVDLKGIIFASTNKELIGKRIDIALGTKEEELFKVLQGEKKEAYDVMVHRGIKVTDYSLPLFQDRLNPTKITGAMHYVEPYFKVEKQIQEMVIQLIFFGLSLFVSIFLLIYLLISRKVILPLSNLTQAMKRVEEKGLGGEVKVSSHDEIGILAERFNQMVRSLKMAEEEKRRSNQFIYRATENIDEGIMLLDRERKILWANRKISQMSNLRASEIIGKHCYEATHHSNEPCKPPFCMCSTEEALKKDKPAVVIHTHFDKNNKSYLELSTYLIKDSEGRVSQFVHLVRDVTERIRLEKDLKQYTSALEKTKGKLQAKVDELEKFTKLSVDRELKMRELKQKIKILEAKINRKD